MLRLAARVAAETTARAGVRYSGNVRTDGVRILYYVDVRAMTETATREREKSQAVYHHQQLMYPQQQQKHLHCVTLTIRRLGDRSINHKQPEIDG